MNQTIGDYRLIDKLGEGAAGEVFLATPEVAKPFAKPGDAVAIKRYKPQILKEARQSDRIEREFKVGSQLSHPNLVRILEYCAPKDAPPYLVMEYVDGVPLDVWVHQFHQIPRRLLLAFAEQLLIAVSELHNAGVLHRDIKPQNIMVTSSFGVKVMDYGVVRILADTAITPEHKFLGTIRYSSPEMLFGRQCDKRTDLYSLGTVFYFLLHGEQVFSQEEQFARLTKLVESEIPKVDGFLKSNDDVLKELLEVTQQLLSKSPDARPPDVDSVLRMLEPVIARVADLEPVKPLHGYIATALTGLRDDSRDAIMFASSKIADVAKDYDVYVYQPRKATDPLLHKEIEASTVYRLDRKRVLEADLLVVLANQPSLGVGQEIEIATAHSIPTILLTREEVSVSRMVTGSPANILDHVRYSAPEDLEHNLRKALASSMDTVRRWRNFARAGETQDIGHAFASLREERGYETASDFASAFGLSGRLLEAFEQGEYENLPLSFIIRLAGKLGASFEQLLRRDKMPTVATPVAMDANLSRLERVAEKLNWGSKEYFLLRDEYEGELAASGRPGVLADEQWMTRHTALEKRTLRQTEEKPDGQQATLWTDDAD